MSEHLYTDTITVPGDKTSSSESLKVNFYVFNA